MLKITLAALVLSLPVFAQASIVQPAAGAPACFKRVYSEDHMRLHPKQKLTELYVGIEGDQWKSQGSPNATPGAKLVGVSEGEYYLNNDANCEYRKDGRTHCQIECDGGAFDLTPRKQSVLFTVAKDYYFPLFKNGADQETASENDTINLQWTDRDNRAYLLVPVPAAECEAAQKRAKTGTWGC